MTQLMHIYINIQDYLNCFTYRTGNGNSACFSHGEVIFESISLSDHMLAYRKTDNG